MIRLAGNGDVENLVRLRQDYFKLTAGASDTDFDSGLLADYFRKHLGRNLLAVIGEIDGVVAASAFLVIIDWPPGPMFPHGKMGRVANVLTYPPYRGRGLATGVMRKLIEEARRLGISRLDLFATAEGEKLYRKLGFLPNSDHTNLQLPLD